MKYGFGAFLLHSFISRPRAVNSYAKHLDRERVNPIKSDRIYRMRLSLKQIIKELSELYKMDPPVADESGHYLVLFDRRFDVENFPTGHRSLVIKASIRAMENYPEPSVSFLKKILQWNFVRAHEQDSSISWDPEEDTLFLYRQIPLEDLNFNLFLEYLEEFLNTLEFWNSAIAAQGDLPTRPPFPSPSA